MTESFLMTNIKHVTLDIGYPCLTMSCTLHHVHNCMHGAAEYIQCKSVTTLLIESDSDHQLPLLVMEVRNYVVQFVRLMLILLYVRLCSLIPRPYLLVLHAEKR